MTRRITFVWTPPDPNLSGTCSVVTTGRGSYATLSTERARAAWFAPWVGTEGRARYGSAWLMSRRRKRLKRPDLFTDVDEREIAEVAADVYNDVGPDLAAALRDDNEGKAPRVHVDDLTELFADQLHSRRPRFHDPEQLAVARDDEKETEDDKKRRRIELRTGDIAEDVWIALNRYSDLNHEWTIQVARDYYKSQADKRGWLYP